ncbi:glycosyltransferase family 2 protein [bacterium SCSIO 12741]|nr:glycosyltransferase family 2 protein [bacterium SCSIO 12741]
MDKKTNIRTPDLSVVIPIYNEQDSLFELHNRLKHTLENLKVSWEILLVNDGSKDRSIEIIRILSQRDERIKYLHFNRNFGHQIAVAAGLDHAQGKAIVIMDGDLQDPPELIPKLYAAHRSGHDIVGARRKMRKGETAFKTSTARLFYRLLNQITSVDIPLDTGDFRLISRRVVNTLRQMPEKTKFFRGQIAWTGFPSTEVLFDRDERKYGKTGYPLWKMMRFAMDGVTGFSTAPLRLVTQMGFLFSFLSFLIILYAGYSHFILERTIAGWTSIVVSTMFIGGVQLISIGILGNYLSRIHRNVQGRPLYVITEQSERFVLNSEF